MKSSGERYDSGLNAAQISYEHWHRYLYVSQFIKGKEVLDIACGEGYGANLLARTAACVTGVDLSEEAVAFASRTYQKNNLQFLRGSVEKIPIDGAGRFDVVVSFETIEHVDAAAQQKFCLEVKRLLKDDGVFIVSSPNKLLYSDTLGHKNEFHRKELYEREFVDLLKKNYTHVALLGQRPLTGSNIWEMSPGRQRNVFTEYEIANKDDRYVPVNGGKQPLYFIALCSQGEIEVPGDSFLGDNALSILTERDEQIAVLRHQAAECDARLGALADELCGVYASKKWKALMRVAPLIGWLKALGTRTPKQAAHWPVQLKSWWKVFLLERRRAGGIPQTAKKAWNMLKRQGWSGVWNGMIYFKARVMRGERILSALERNHYPEWIRRFDTLTEEDRSKLCAVTETLRVKPLISVVMPLYNAKPQWLKEAISSEVPEPNAMT
ncbi:MAG: methyltransferase domain-containing protein, partial [Candidatus Omnitrophota bacterium]